MLKILDRMYCLIRHSYRTILLLFILSVFLLLIYNIVLLTYTCTANFYELNLNKLNLSLMECRTITHLKFILKTKKKTPKFRSRKFYSPLSMYPSMKNHILPASTTCLVLLYINSIRRTLNPNEGEYYYMYLYLK